MQFDFSEIRFIFQIPLAWFKSIHARVFKAYGGNMLDVREGADGGMYVGIDQAAFEDAVARIGGAGTVKNVDGKDPDENGNVSFGLTAGRIVVSNAEGHLSSNGALTASKWMKTDASGLPSTTTDTPAVVSDATPNDVSTSSGSSGSDSKASRADHVHKLPSSVITTSDITKARLTSLGQGKSGSFTVVTGVTWNGSTLDYTKISLTVTNGVITSIGTSSTTTIDTPVAET